MIGRMTGCELRRSLDRRLPAQPATWQSAHRAGMFRRQQARSRAEPVLRQCCRVPSAFTDGVCPI